MGVWRGGGGVSGDGGRLVSTRSSPFYSNNKRMYLVKIVFYFYFKMAVINLSKCDQRLLANVMLGMISTAHELGVLLLIPCYFIMISAAG